MARLICCSMIRSCLIFYLYGASIAGSNSFACSGKLTFLAEDLPPLHFRSEQQQAMGALVDLAHLVIKQTGFEGEVEIVPQARAQHEAKHQVNVFLLSQLRTPSREQLFQWAGQTYSTQAFLLGLSSQQHAAISQMVQAKRYKVGTVRGYYAEHYLRSLGFTEKQNLVLTSSQQSLWDLLYKGRIDFVLTNFLGLEREVKAFGHNPKLLQPYVHIPDYPSELNLATGLATEPTCVAKIAAALNTLKMNGEYNAIMSKWGI